MTKLEGELEIEFKLKIWIWLQPELKPEPESNDEQESDFEPGLKYLNVSIHSPEFRRYKGLEWGIGEVFGTKSAIGETTFGKERGKYWKL